MVHILTEISKYILIVLFAVYTLSSFTVLFRGSDPDQEKKIYRRQGGCMFAFHFICFLVIFAVEQELKVWVFYIAQVGLCLVIFLIYRVIYKYAARLIVNHMCMLMLFGFTILTRLNFDAAVRQFEIAVVAVIFTAFVPMLVVKVKNLRRLTWVYCVIGILALGAVAAIGPMTYGAKISFTIAGISIQPSEFVKIIFVLFVACRLYQSTHFKDIVITTILAAIHVLILVVSSDLGAALIFFVTYICMLFVATRAPIYLLGGFGVGILAALAGSKVFSHVKVRIAAWKDPFANIDGGGYQVAQAMFAIGTGGWFGLGLYQGMPESIPVQTSDFVFAAIAEEFGGIVAVCIILICFSCFVMITNVSMRIRDRFYQMIALGFGVAYGTQVFLNIGGVIKCIPSTGVQLPFVSSGGSSIFCTIIMFAIIQGLYILRHQESESDELLLMGPEHETWRDVSGNGNETIRTNPRRSTAARKPQGGSGQVDLGGERVIYRSADRRLAEEIMPEEVMPEEAVQKPRRSYRQTPGQQTQAEEILPVDDEPEIMRNKERGKQGYEQPKRRRRRKWEQTETEEKW